MKYGAHTIDAVKFTHRQDSQLAPVVCSCGLKLTVEDWPQHLRDNGRRASVTGFRATEQSQSKTFSFGRQKYRKDEA